MENQDYITLKWGTLKSWKLTSPKAKELIKQYNEVGSCVPVMLQKIHKNKKN